MAEQSKDTEEKQAQQGEHPVFNAQKIYIKDISFESPQSPELFTHESGPQIDVNLQIRHRELDKDHGIHEVVLSTTVTAKTGDKTAFLVEVHQGGVFQVQGVGDQEREMVLEIACPNILLPFAREAVADIVAKGGFPQLLINPINFEALYQQKKQAEAKKQAAGAAKQ